MTYDVLLFDNDVTTFDFAQSILMDFFDYNENDAIQMCMCVMWYEEPQVIRTYDDFDLAMRKVNDAMVFIELNSDSLQIIVRPLVIKGTSAL